jgi:putative redox protein
MKEMTITLPGGMRVDAEMGDHVIRTDQSVADGGEGSAPEPYALFLASIGTCAGAYVIGFCRARDIPSEHIRLIQKNEFEGNNLELKKVRIEIQVPPDFPRKYYKALARTAGLCNVKRDIATPPAFEIETTLAD